MNSSQRSCIAVHVSLPDPDSGKPRLVAAGHLFFCPDSRAAVFAYRPNYVGPPLDPVHLNHRSGVRRFLFRSDEGLPGALSRLLPDAMSRRLIRIQDPSRPPSDQPNRWLSNVSGLYSGGLYVVAMSPRIAPGAPAMEYREQYTHQGHLGLVFRAQDPSRFSAVVEDHLLLGHGHDAVGLTLQDRDGQQWIGMFPSIPDPVTGHAPRPRMMEAIHRALAAGGFETLPHRLATTANGEPVSLTALPFRRGNRDLFHLRYEELPGRRAQTFREIAEIVRNSSQDPAADMQRLADHLIVSLAFDSRDNDYAGLLIGDRNGFRISPVGKIAPSHDFARYRIIPPEVSNLEDPSAWVFLAQETGIPKSNISLSLRRLFASLQELPRTGAETGMDPDDWATLVQGISTHLPSLSRHMKQAVEHTRSPAPPSAASGPAPG